MPGSAKKKAAGVILLDPELKQREDQFYTSLHNHNYVRENKSKKMLLGMYESDLENISYNKPNNLRKSVG